MITVIGGIETTVKIKMMPTKPKEEADKGNNAKAAAPAGRKSTDEKSVGGMDATGFEAYFRKQQMMQQQDNYWNEVGTLGGSFGSYSAVSQNPDSDITVRNDGCGYNVARIAAREYDGEVAFISIVGEDALGLAAMCQLKDAGVNVDAVKTCPGSTPVKIEMRNLLDDLEFIRKDEKLLKLITPDFLEEYDEKIGSSDVIFIDGSLPVETIKFIAGKYSDKKIFFDPGSLEGARKFAEAECGFYGVIPGRRESEIMTDLMVLGMDQLMEAGNYLAGKGVMNTVITLKGGGLYYKDGDDEKIIKPERVLSFADTTGAGDTVSAAIVTGIASGKSLADSAEDAIAAAAAYLKDVEDISAMTQLKRKGMC